MAKRKPEAPQDRTFQGEMEKYANDRSVHIAEEVYGRSRPSEDPRVTAQRFADEGNPQAVYPQIGRVFQRDSSPTTQDWAHDVAALANTRDADKVRGFAARDASPAGRSNWDGVANKAQEKATAIRLRR